MSYAGAATLRLHDHGSIDVLNSYPQFQNVSVVPTVQIAAIEAMLASNGDWREFTVRTTTSTASGTQSSNGSGHLSLTDALGAEIARVGIGANFSQHAWTRTQDLSALSLKEDTFITARVPLSTLPSGSAKRRVIAELSQRAFRTTVTGGGPPLAFAGPDLTVECASPLGTSVQIDGSQSSDPDGDSLTYKWTSDRGRIESFRPVVTGLFPLGATHVALQVSDGVLQPSADALTVAVVDTLPPVLTCPPSITVECSATGGTPATDPAIASFLHGASSIDRCEGELAVGNDAPKFFPKGRTVVTFSTGDSSGNQSRCSSDLIVRDSIPPVVTCKVGTETLWPPDHRLINVHLAFKARDICDPNPETAIRTTSDENPSQEEGSGGSVHCPDADLEGNQALLLRSERSGRGDGRVYAVTVLATDDASNTGTCTIPVRVPHDRKRPIAGDSGQAFDAATCGPSFAGNGNK
jgi:hypothetical protein